MRRRTLRNFGRPDDGDSDLELDDETRWRVLLEEHPSCLRQQEGEVGAVKLSDFLTQRELHRTWVYDTWFAPQDLEYELVVAIPSPLWHTKTFLFGRSRAAATSPSATGSSSICCSRIWRGSGSRPGHIGCSSSALAELDRVDEHDRRGVILLGLGGEVEFASPPTERLLREFFPARSGGQLPAALAEWLESGDAKPLIRRRGERRLTVQQADGALLLEERHERIELTAREREVLAWVARGKTNAEIARLLWIEPSTVGKHLENVYPKLGVSTRTAAAARFFGLNDAEAS